MICRIDYVDRVLLVGQNPPAVYATTRGHVERLERKPDGHYAKEDMTRLVEDGHAVLYDEDMLRDILQALGTLVFGC